jgi:hypothetical protein
MITSALFSGKSSNSSTFSRIYGAILQKIRPQQEVSGKDANEEMASRSGKNFVLWWITFQLVLSGCVHDPYRNRLLDDGHGGEKKYFFAYGKFCGPGYPPLKPGYKNIAEETVAMWPPNDELDAMCYAHDLCYEGDAVTAVCDEALHEMLIASAGKLKGAGCHHLAGDMSIAFFAHCSINGENRAATLGNRVACWSIGAPTALFFAIIEAPFSFRKYPPAENTCSTSDNLDFRATVHTFEAKYQKTIINQGHKPIRIPMPDDVTLRTSDPSSGRVIESNTRP